MEISRFLGKVIGLYLIIVSIAILINMPKFVSTVNELINNVPLMFVTGFFTLVLGLLLVVSHNIWQWNWRVIITIIAWISLLKGISIVLYPEIIDHATHWFVENSTFGYITGSIDLILGLILCYFGFRR